MKKSKAFTLAEVLITLGIIGIVAEMTLPSLISDYNKTIYITSLKKAYNTFQDGMKLYMASQGVFSLADTDIFGLDESFDLSTRETAFDSIIKSKFNTTKSCIGADGDTSCQYAATYLDNSASFTMLKPNSIPGEIFGTIAGGAGRGNSYSFYSNGGFSFQVFLMRVDTCRPDYAIKGAMKAFCGEVMIDVNGPKQPNKIGRDIFGFYLGHDGSLYPYYGRACIEYANKFFNAEDYYWRNDATLCGAPNNSDVSGALGLGCAARIMENGWQMDY